MLRGCAVHSRQRGPARPTALSRFRMSALGALLAHRGRALGGTKMSPDNVNIDALSRALKAAWSRETAWDPEIWTSDNPASGQCAVTSLVLQDYFGGALIRGAVDRVPHYWNELPSGEEIDLTFDQFPKGVEHLRLGMASRVWVLSYSDTQERYAALGAAVKARLADAPQASSR